MTEIASWVPEGAALHRMHSGVLDAAWLEFGPQTGVPIVLAHGFPYDPSSFVESARILAERGFRCLLPYQRGFGPSRFLDPATPRSGEQAALTFDLLSLIETLGLTRPVIGGFDWGARAACGVAAIAPERIGALVSVGGYNIFGPPQNEIPASPDWAHRAWYMHFFHHPRAEVTLERERAAFCRYIWPLWSPNWTFGDAEFAAAAAAFENPDFVEVVLHSYRHRTGAAPGDPALAALAAELERQPAIAVPTLVVHGDADAIQPVALSERLERFTGWVARHVVPGAGHNPAQEAPRAFADLVALAAGWRAVGEA